MSKVLLFSHSGFSNENANGITMKNLLSAWSSDEKAEFYCDVQPPDFTAADNYFRVTDIQMLTAFVGKKTVHIFSANTEDAKAVKTQTTDECGNERARRIPPWLKKRKYNFGLKWLREILWIISPWGHHKLDEWIKQISPDVLVYMVGESIFMDRLVLRVCRMTQKPLVLYNGEAYRIIDCRERHGLERIYYRSCQKYYVQLAKEARLVIYNSEMLKQNYENKYVFFGESVVAYNSAESNFSEYCPNEKLKITYFGNLGVGRVDSLLQTADALTEIDPSCVIDVYGNAPDGELEKLSAHPGIIYHGFASAEQLHEIIDASDILLHVESFDPAYIDKLKYAFSTKIAQCFCAGRCLFSYAPKGTASTQYLLSTESAVVAAAPDELKNGLALIINNKEIRTEYAKRAKRLATQKHDMASVSRQIKDQVGVILRNEANGSRNNREN